MVDQRLSIHDTYTKEENLEAIREVVMSVNWLAVQRCMELLEWVWALDGAFRVPTVEELINEATTRCVDSVERSLTDKRDCRTYSGGIDILTRYLPHGSIGLEVLFVLENADNY